MTEKVQIKGKDHQANLFHHGLVKVIVLDQLSQINLPWEAFMQSASLFPATSQPSIQSTPLEPPRPQEVGSLRKPSVTKTYSRGKRLVFAPNNVERV